MEERSEDPVGKVGRENCELGEGEFVHEVVRTGLSNVEHQGLKVECQLESMANGIRVRGMSGDNQRDGDCDVHKPLAD